MERFYIGRRSSKGCFVFVREGNRIARLPNKGKHSPTGFEWGYAGSGPADLAYSLLFDATHDDQLAASLYQQFKVEVINNLPFQRWEMPQWFVLAWIRSSFPEQLKVRIPKRGSGIAARLLTGGASPDELSFIRRVWSELNLGIDSESPEEINLFVDKLETLCEGRTPAACIAVLTFVLDRILTALKKQGAVPTQSG